MNHTIVPLYNGTYSCRYGYAEGNPSIPRFDNTPCFAFLVVDEKGELVLFDTGFHEDYVFGIDSLSIREEKDGLRQALSRAGHTPEEIKIVIMSHLHWDHTGGMRYFPHADFIVQAAELNWFFSMSPKEELYCCPLHWIDLLDKFKLINGNYEIKTGIEIVYTNSHSAGHQALKIQTREGVVVLGGDGYINHDKLRNTLPEDFPQRCRSGGNVSFSWTEGILEEIRVLLKAQGMYQNQPPRPFSLRRELRRQCKHLYFAHDPELRNIETIG